MKNNQIKTGTNRLHSGGNRLIYYFVALLFICNSGFAQATKKQQQKTDSLFAQWNNDSTPGMELIVMRHGKIIMNRSYGLANVAAKTPNSTIRTMWVASMSKQFTALAIALLIDQKKISLEDDIRKYLPEIPTMSDPVRIRHLVYHTSGLRDGFTLTAMSFKGEDEYTNANVLKYLALQKGRNFRPGERFEYNNSGYVLLATVVERVSGMSFPEFTSKYIFKPLGMNQSRFVNGFPVGDSSIATGYSVSQDGGRKTYETAHFKGRSYGSTGLITTAADLVKWDRVFYEPVFSKKVQQLQVKTGILNNGHSIPYAFGLEVEPFRGKMAITHSGADAGYKAEIARFPEDELTVICLANTEDAYNNTDRLFKVAALFIDLKKDHWGATKNCRPEAGAYLDKETLAAMRFVRTESGVGISGSPDGYYQPLEALNNCIFGVKDIAIDQYNFQRGCLEYTTRAVQASFYPVKQAFPAADKLKERAGAYYSVELGVTYHLFEKDGTLFLKFFDAYDVPLTPYEGDLFAGEFLGTNIIHFLTDNEGKIIGMEFNRDGIHGLAFMKQ